MLQENWRHGTDWWGVTFNAVCCCHIKITGRILQQNSYCYLLQITIHTCECYCAWVKCTSVSRFLLDHGLCGSNKLLYKWWALSLLFLHLYLSLQSCIDWLIEHGFTSAPTQYRLYGRRFLQVWWPNQQCQLSKHWRRVVSHPDRPQSNYAHLTVLQY